MRNNESVRVQLTVKPGAKVPGLLVEKDAFVLRVRARAVEGAANEACIQALAHILGVAPSSITLLRGHRSRIKTFAIAGIDERVLRERMLAYGVAAH